MNSNLVPRMIELWLVVNITALLVLAVMAYLSGKWILDGLERLDRWLSAPRKKDTELPSTDTLH